MMMPHPLIPVSLPPASVTMAMSQMNHLSTIANMAAAAQGQSLPSRMVTSVIKVTFKTVRFLFKLWSSWSWIFIWVVLLLLLGLQERVQDSPSPAPSLEDHRRPGSHPSSHRSSSVSSSPAHTESSSDRIRRSPVSRSKRCFEVKVDITFSFTPPPFQRFTTTACPWTTPCSACPPTSPLGPKRETWPTTWVTKQQHTKGFTLTKVRRVYLHSLQVLSGTMVWM